MGPGGRATVIGDVMPVRHGSRLSSDKSKSGLRGAVWNKIAATRKNERRQMEGHVAVEKLKEEGVDLIGEDHGREGKIEIANKVAELGGVHKYDLTPQVTHLIVGEYDTPKYRHVARERPDILPMDAQWIEALSDLWKNDDEIDFDALETQHRLKALETCGIEPSSQPGEMRPRESLLICLTGFGRQRDDIADIITANGGRYTGDLTKRCTHLIVSKPEGKKFSAAKGWDVYTVTLDWLTMSVDRGMILEETKFDPMLPPEEIGKGAWKKRDAILNDKKRSRSEVSIAAEEGPRKLRKSASMKLSSQRNNIWGDILGRSMSKEYSFADEHQPVEQPTAVQEQPPPPVLEEKGVLDNCVFCADGFNDLRTQVLTQSVTSLGATMVATIDEAMQYTAHSEQLRRFLIVPQNSQPETHPQIDHENMHIVTEFYIEKCLHNKRFFEPNEHVLGRPFPLFPIPGFEHLQICKAAFTGIELSQVARSVTQLGAKFVEDLRKSTSVLVCKSLPEVRKHKLHWALTWGVPVVPEDWLWECISTGYRIPFDDFIYPELRTRYRVRVGTPQPNETAQRHTKNSDKLLSCAEQGKETPDPEVSMEANFAADLSVSKHDNSAKPDTKLRAEESVTMADFSTAQTHLVESFAGQQEDQAHRREGDEASEDKTRLTVRGGGPKRTRSEPSAHAVPIVGEEISERAPSAPPVEAENVGVSTDTDSLKAAEEEKRQAKAAEREQLTSKITSLIQSATGSAGSADTEGSANAPRARRRRILGRAISNTSNASSAASVDTSKRIPESFHGGEIADSEDEASQQPPATQLGYNYPEAQEYKAAYPYAVSLSVPALVPSPTVTLGISISASLGNDIIMTVSASVVIQPVMHSNYRESIPSDFHVGKTPDWYNDLEPELRTRFENMAPSIAPSDATMARTSTPLSPAEEPAEDQTAVEDTPPTLMSQAAVVPVAKTKQYWREQ
ncbi:S-M checkpoint control protein rad4 [Paramyrothecium foliicola]|nr:S-M checkpoint control protein rad4 [Paramyrothecium foliicola]